MFVFRKCVPPDQYNRLKKQWTELVRKHRDFRSVLLSSELREVRIGDMPFTSVLDPTAAPLNETLGFSAINLVSFLSLSLVLSLSLSLSLSSSKTGACLLTARRKCKFSNLFEWHKAHVLFSLFQHICGTFFHTFNNSISRLLLQQNEKDVEYIKERLDILDGQQRHQMDELRTMTRHVTPLHPGSPDGLSRDGSPVPTRDTDARGSSPELDGHGAGDADSYRDTESESEKSAS